MLNINTTNVIQDLRRKFGRVLVENDNEFRVCCPECPDRSGKVDVKFKLYINPTKVNQNDPTLIGTWHCFRCGFKGWGLKKLGVTTVEPSVSVDRLSHELLPKNNKPKNTNVLNTVKLNVKSKKPNNHLSQRIKLPPTFNTKFSSILGQASLKYLQSRNVSLEDIRKYNIGYCPSGPLQGYVVFPVYEDKKLVYYVGRSILKKQYKNSPGKSGAVLFNFTKQKEVILVEGILDALSVGGNAVAMLGKILKKGQFKKLLQNPPNTITILLDSDAKKEALDIVRKLDGYIPTIRIANLPKGKDPNELKPNKLEEIIKNAQPSNQQSTLSLLLIDEPEIPET